MSIPSVRLSPSTQRRTRMSARLLVTGIGLAVVAAGLVAWVVKSADAQATVVMVTQPVAAFTTVQASDVQTITVPAKSVAAGAITNPSQIVGQLTDTTLYPNVQLTTQEFVAGNESTSPLASQLSQLGNSSLRAVGLTANDISFPGGTDIVPGDHIDIVSTAQFQVNGSGSGSQSQNVSMSKLVLSDVPVLSVESQGSNVSGIVVAVNPTQAVELLYLQGNGTLSFLLDPFTPNTNAANSAPTVTGNWLLGQLQVSPQGGSTLSQLPPPATTTAPNSSSSPSTSTTSQHKAKAQTTTNSSTSPSPSTTIP